MGRYCKAYPADRLRQFSGWPRETAADVPEDERYYFLQENYTVTKDIFLEDIVFDQVSNAWRRFCHDTLAFEIPAEILDPPSSPSSAGSAETVIVDAGSSAVRDR